MLVPTMMFRILLQALLVVHVLVASAGISTSEASTDGLSAENFLMLGDRALAADQLDDAIEYYERALSFADLEDESLLTILSLRTNLGTALSSMGREEQAADAYRTAVLAYSDEIGNIVDTSLNQDATNIAAQASFFLGMVYQELEEPRKAADAYAYANTLDPYHWASLGNLGSVLHDELKQHAEALVAYNKAYEILTQAEVEPTDPPGEPRFILSQLQYRIGLAIIHSPERKCALTDDPNTEVPCLEMAANAFSMAVKFDSDNESAKHMLATVTADATMTRASNVYVKSLFDDYAQNFEHSLVDELQYTGYERLRRGFDRALGGQDEVPRFRLVVDAGCGTGLVGEQFRNASDYLVGVDLSEAIIQEANIARPGLYNETRADDVMEVFRNLKPISLIIAGDSFIYFGDLVPLFESMAEGLEDGGFLAFTLENVNKETEDALVESKPDWRWQLTASGRFAHRKDYVQLVGASFNLKLIHYEPMVDFRYESGVGVQGHIFVMQKQRLDNKEL